jgi:cytochrome bd-type quinol oxidase subunit 1
LEFYLGTKVIYLEIGDMESSTITELTSTSREVVGENPSIVLGIFMLLLGIAFIILAVVGNGLVILVYLIDPKIRSSTSNAYLVSLAFIDFLIGAIVIPFGWYYQYRGR